MANGKNDPGAAANQVIVLAFDLFETEIADLPSQLAIALDSPQVRASIQKTLLDFAKTKIDPNKTQITAAEAAKLFEALGTGVKEEGSKVLLAQIKNTPEFKKLESSLEAFKTAAASTSLGVWVDHNKNILYVVGAALVVGTASVLYVTKTGGPIVKQIVNPLQDKQFDVVQLGKLKIKAGLWKFEPDAAVLGAKVVGEVKWQQVMVEVKFGILAQAADIQKVEGAVVVKSGGFHLNLTGEGLPQTRQVNLGLKLDYKGTTRNGNFNVGIGAMYQDQLMGGQLNAGFETKQGVNFGLSGNLGQQKGGGTQYGGLFTITIPL